MNLNEYQRCARDTAIYPDDYAVIYPALGLAGESGEFADYVKKAIRDDDGVITGERRMMLVKELGDILWYAANAAHDLGYTLDEIAKLNLDKLYSRKERGVLAGDGDDR